MLEYKIKGISNKPFYIKEHNQKYNIKEITQFLKKFNFRLYILLICEEIYEKYFNISRNLMKRGKL